MSLMKKANGSNAVRTLVDNVKTAINQAGDAFVSPNATEGLISLESLNDNQAQQIHNEFAQMHKQLLGIMQAVPGLESFSADDAASVRARDVALEAGAMVAMAAANPAAYAEKAYRGEATASAGVQLVEPMTYGAGGAQDYRSNVALEAFDDRELKEFLPYSIAFNIFASRQDEFGEMLYPTTVVPPDQGGVDVSVSRLQVFNEVRHAITGKAVSFGKKNLIDAAVDATILADESTRLVPVRLEDDSNASYFVPEAVVAPTGFKVAGVDVPTAPLAMGNEVDLIGISTYQPLVGAGVMDSTDSLDNRISVEALYLQIDAASPGVKFNTARAPRNSFVKSIEGNGREMNLQFGIRDLIIDKNTKAVDGSTVTAFNAIATGDYTVRVGVTVNGTANVEFGNVSVFASSVKVVSIHDANGNEVSTASGAGASIKAALEAFTIAGYDLNARRTNANRRTRGLLLDNTTEVERYTIPLGAPISVPAPVGSNREATDLKALVAAGRLRNSNNAITQLFNYAEQLEAFVKGPKVSGQVPSVQGMGRYLVTPFFERHELDLETSINSIKSHEKAADVQAVLVNAIRDVAYRAYRDSKLQAALDAVTGGTGETPVLLIGTDQVLVRHLMIDGDTRTFGIAFEKSVIKSSMDRRMANKIVITFGRASTDGPDALHFGTHAWMPELTSTMPVTRNGAVTKETMVQPRTTHFNNLPILAILEVKNLTKVLADKIQTPATDSDVTQPYLAGLSIP